MDDEITRLDTNQSKVPTIDPYICGIIQEHQQIWAYTNKQTQHDMFLASSYYRDFLEANPEYAESKFGVGYTVWMEALAVHAAFITIPGHGHSNLFPFKNISRFGHGHTKIIPIKNHI